MTLAERYARLPTAAKLLLILSAALLPIGIGLTLVGDRGIRSANAALEGRRQDQAQDSARAIESLIARNALALRVAANGALATRGGDPCLRTQRSLGIAPAVAQAFELEGEDGRPLCSAGKIDDTGGLPLVAPGDIRVRIAPNNEGVAVRAGVIGGMATAVIPTHELRSAVEAAGGGANSVLLLDGVRRLPVFGPADENDPGQSFTKWPIGHGAVTARVGSAKARITTADRLLLLLPVLMWVAAALITWSLVSRLLIRPLRLLERGVRDYAPGSSLVLPRKLGPAREIQELRDAFSRAVARVEESEREMTGALEGQRRLVREVHHRVKNNLQVVASLLNIHGRSAEGTQARAAYAGISRRVGALSIVHRNHFAEMEENRGIAVRPLLSELTAELRVGAPEEARGLNVELDLDTVYTTQDVAVAVAFLVTEMVEFAMLRCPHEPIDISLRRTSELTARLMMSSPVLVPDEADEPEKVQFERIVQGLAKQLRSTLERKLGRYSVDLPVFPPV
ncbi:MAG: sensor histidine kinase [Sphingomicrobium sp.]